jgi:hypothetical protein
MCLCSYCRCQWTRGLGRGSAADRLLGMLVRIPPGSWMSIVSVVCCKIEAVASGRSLVQRSPTECGCEALIMRRPWTNRGWWATKNVFLFLRPYTGYTWSKARWSVLMFMKRRLWSSLKDISADTVLDLTDWNASWIHLRCGQNSNRDRGCDGLAITCDLCRIAFEGFVMMQLLHDLFSPSTEIILLNSNVWHRRFI